MNINSEEEKVPVAAEVTPEEASNGKNRHGKRKEKATGEKTIVVLPPELRTGFTDIERHQLKQMQRLVDDRQFEAAQVAGNTALIPRGQEVAKELEAIARLLDNAKNLFVSQKIQEHGYPQGFPCHINLETGEILLDGEPAWDGKKPEEAPK